MTLAEVLRAAADRIDQLAAAATGQRWEATENYPDAWEVWSSGVTHAIAKESGHGDIPEADARWIATMGPQVASHLASWLRGHAEYTAAAQCAPDGHAVAFARAVLGETGEQP